MDLPSATLALVAAAGQLSVADLGVAAVRLPVTAAIGKAGTAIGKAVAAIGMDAMAIIVDTGAAGTSLLALVIMMVATMATAAAVAAGYGNVTWQRATRATNGVITTA